MPTCDACATYFTFGAYKAGDYKFCTEQCFKRGAVLQILDGVRPDQVTEYVNRQRMCDCPTCGGGGPVDVRQSYRVYSLLVYTSWRTDNKIECQRCGRKRQLRDLMFFGCCGLVGSTLGFSNHPGTDNSQSKSNDH
jgi:hypothetical protein